MNLINFHELPQAPYLSEQRKIERHEVIHLLAITERGTGQILDISREGLSFGCLYPHTFPYEFYIDILDANGCHIKKIKVRKMWETSGETQEPTEIFELEVGVEFAELTASQSEELDYLLDDLELVDFPYQNLA